MNLICLDMQPASEPSISRAYQARPELAHDASLVWQAEPVKVAFRAELWLWDARRTQDWTFVSLPARESEEIRDLVGGLRRGFGSVRVRATIGTSTWTTSIFPASQGSYVLPVKRPYASLKTSASETSQR